jgi:protocatechuate 3,4-dioxygenase beta subunit
MFGTVMKYTNNIKEIRYDTEPMKDIRLVIQSGNHKYETTTDAEGRYQFNSLPEGVYRVRADIPSYLIYDGPQSVRIKGRGCLPVDITARRKNNIEGRVFDVNDSPMKYVPISLVSADAATDEILSKDHNAWTYALTNEQGYYYFSHLAPGRYFLIINRTDVELLPNGDRVTVPRLFYPGVRDITQALVITLTQDKEPQKYDFHLPQK